MSYKIVTTKIGVQTDAGLVELESIQGVNTESREALDNFFQKWRILSVDTTIRQIPKIQIPIQEPKQKEKSERKKPRIISTCGFLPQERKEIALSKLPSEFTINDWLKVFDSTAITEKERFLLKKNYAYDTRCLLADGKIVFVGKEGVIHKYRIVEKVASPKEKEEAIKKVIEDRSTFEGTFK